MATPYKVKVAPENTGLFKAAQALTPEAADKVSELLQKDLDVGSALRRRGSNTDSLIETPCLLQRTGFP